MSSDDAALAKLAGAILDGTPIDWDAVDLDATPPDRPLVRHLKAIAAIAGAQSAGLPDMWGPLRLLERIGQGAFGDVYRAWDPRLDREVALKLLPVDPVSSNQLATSIIEEGRLLARIRHPSVVTIYGAERIDDRVGLWMEYVDGRTLHQLVVEDGRRFSPSEVAALGQALCGAVAAVHAAGLLHRDIKAQNVMMAREGRVALMDFGTGHEQREGSEAVLAGTPLYLAPEVLTGAMEPTVQSDVYSVGVLLFFVLAGSYPVTGGDLVGLRAAHEREERRSLKAVRPDVPRRLRGVIERAIDPDPGRRYPSAAALATALGRVSTAPWKALSYGGTAAALVLAALIVSRPSAPAGVDRPQIAVLPLANVTTDVNDAYFADGLTDEIIRNLGTVRSLDVRSRESSFAFKGTQKSVGEVGRELGVDYMLEVSSVRADGRLRVNTRLVQVEGEIPVWSKPFERDLTVVDILSIQDDISLAVVNSLSLTLDHRQRRDASNLQTYELYLRARALADTQGVSGPLQAVSLFEKIIASDPAYARAHAGLVLAYAYLSRSPYQSQVPFEKAHAVMRSAAIEAVRLDPMLAEAHAARGWVHAAEFEWVEAERAFRRAIDLNRVLIFSYTSFTFSTLQQLGRVAEAEQLLREAERIDPLAAEVQLALGRVLVQANKPSEAIVVLERVRGTESILPLVDLQLGRALALDGRIEESLPLLERRRERLVDPAGGPHPWVAFAYVKLGRRADAERLAWENDRLPFRRAIINAALGDTDRMFDGLDEMADREPQRLVLLLRAPELAPYRQDERFTRLLRRARLD